MTRLVPGEYVSLRGPVLGQRISGVVRGTWTADGTTYVSLYSHARREELLYAVDARGIARRPRVPGDSTPTVDSGEPLGGSGRRWWLIGAIVLAALLVPLVTAGITRLQVAPMSFDSFLASDVSLRRLVTIVSARVSYDRDVENYWSPAEGVWQTRRGDCEDFAMVISTYLARQGVEHTVAGFALKEDLAGHAVVIADIGTARVLLDPTMATAPTGIRYFPADASGRLPSNAEVLADYARLPAVTYETPPEPGRPAPQGYIGHSSPGPPE
jgi:hypothetical protein